MPVNLQYGDVRAEVTAAEAAGHHLTLPDHHVDSSLRMFIAGATKPQRQQLALGFGSAPFLRIRIC